MFICNSPQLFAACHVLLRRHVPRHPPYPLCSLFLFRLLFRNPSNFVLVTFYVSKILDLSMCFHINLIFLGLFKVYFFFYLCLLYFIVTLFFYPLTSVKKQNAECSLKVFTSNALCSCQSSFTNDRWRFATSRVTAYL